MSDGVTRGVLVAHSALSEALIQAVDRIAGLEPGVVVGLSNEGLAPDAIRDRLAELVGDGPAIVFTDLKEGSCGLAARRVCIGRPDNVLITGVNLPMLLDFVFNRHLPLEELVERVMQRGRAAIERIPEPTG